MTGREREKDDEWWRNKHAAPFPSTHASDFADGGEDDSLRRRRLEQFSRRYWAPVYAVMRQRGLQDADAQDATQAFFADVVEKGVLQKYDTFRGRFRNFIRVSVLNYVRDVRLDDARERRAQDAAARSAPDPTDPGDTFDRAWIKDVLDRALEKGSVELERRGRPGAVDLCLRFYERACAQRLNLEPLAAEAGMPVADFKAQLVEARARLRIEVTLLLGDMDTGGTDEDRAEELRMIFGDGR